MAATLSSSIAVSSRESFSRPIKSPSFLSIAAIRVAIARSCYGSSSFCMRKKPRLEITSFVNTQPESQSGVVRTPILKENEAHLIGTDGSDLVANYLPKPDAERGDGDLVDGNGGNGNGGNGKFRGGGNNEEEEEEEEEFGPLLNFDEVVKEAEAVGAILPSDMLEAKSVGIRKLLLMRYLGLQGSARTLGFEMKTLPMLWNRMLTDPSFLFKIGLEIAIDSCGAIFAEVQKRGKDFWAEFELNFASLLVGAVVNVALAGMLAPYVLTGQPSASQGYHGRIQRSYGASSSSVFEAEQPGCSFTGKQGTHTYSFERTLNGNVGFGCVITGQGTANSTMTAKRHIENSEGVGIPIRTLLENAAAQRVSSNTRDQFIEGLERVDASQAACSSLTELVGVVSNNHSDFSSSRSRSWSWSCSGSCSLSLSMSLSMSFQHSYSLGASKLVAVSLDHVE